MGKVKLPLFCVNWEQVIPIYAGGSARFWDLASCWPLVDFVHPTWVKFKVPWLVGIFLASHTCSAYFIILYKISATLFCDIPYFFLTSHDFCYSLLGINPLSLCRRIHSWQFRKSEGNNKVEIKLECLVGLGVFFVSTIPMWNVIGFSNGLVTLSSWDLINFLYGDYLLSPNFDSSGQWSIKNFSK